MKKVMFVTMGTSLFHSASWEGALPSPVRHYKEWCDEKERLKSPERRQLSPHSQQIKADLEGHLSAKNAEEWASCLPKELVAGNPDSSTLMRFNAELSTILKLGLLSEERNGAASLADFLRSYSAIHIAYDDRAPEDGGKHLPLIAAAHLKAYLDRIAGQGIASFLEIPGLSSKDSAVLIGTEHDPTGLTRLRNEIQKLIDPPHLPDQIDFVISGGYKIYGVALARLTALKQPRVRLIYTHESSELVIFSGDRISVEGEDFPSPLAAFTLVTRGGPN